MEKVKIERLFNNYADWANLECESVEVYNKELKEFNNYINNWDNNFDGWLKYQDFFDYVAIYDAI